MSKKNDKSEPTALSPVQQAWAEQTQKGELLPILRPGDHMTKTGDSIILEPLEREPQMEVLGDTFSPYLLPVRRYHNDTLKVYCDEYLIIGDDADADKDEGPLNGPGKQIARFLHPDAPLLPLVMTRQDMIWKKQKTHTFTFRKL